MSSGKPVGFSESEFSIADVFAAHSQEAVPDGRHAGGELEGFRTEDRAWRERRNVAMRRWIDHTVSLGKLGFRMRNWAWGLAFGGTVLMMVSLPAAQGQSHGPFPREVFALLCLFAVAMALFGLLLLPLGRLLREFAILRRRLLLRKAKRDGVEVGEPARRRRSE